jgi:hypothetical protein
MPNIAQVRRLQFNGEEIGMGFNSESGLAIGTALEGFTVQANPVASGQEVLASIYIVNSHEELMQNLGMSFEAQGRYGFISASLKARFSESSNYNSTSTFLVARCIVQNPLVRGENFRAQSSAQALLDAVRFDEFKRAYGDSFVRGLQTGGEFYTIIRITSVSSTKQVELAAALHAEYNGLITSGGFQVQFSQANASTSTSSEYTATMYQKAGSGEEIAPSVEISEVLSRYKNFPQIVKMSPVAYETEVATYDTLPLPVPTPEEQDDFLFALRDAREKKLHYIQTRNDLEFALQNPLFFEGLPANAVLTSTINVYTQLINAVIDHAVRLSRGEITPPHVFDSSKGSPPIVEPAPLLLQRVALPTIQVQSCVGLDRRDIEIVLRWNAKTMAFIQDTVNAGRAGGDSVLVGLPNGFTQERLDFIWSVFAWIKEEPPDLSPDGSWEGGALIVAQFPESGMIAPGSEVIWQLKKGIT